MYFERLLVSQLQRHIDPHIPCEQFGFMRGSSTSDAGVSLASTITTAINQRAEARLVALDIKGAFDSRAYWLIFGVLVFMIRHLDYLNLIYQTDIYELLHLWILQNYALLRRSSI